MPKLMHALFILMFVGGARTLALALLAAQAATLAGEVIFDNVWPQVCPS